MHAMLYSMQDSVNFIIIVNYIRHRLLVYRTATCIRIYVAILTKISIVKTFQKYSLQKIGKK